MTRLIEWVRWLAGYAEPVRARAVAMAVLGLAAALGLTTQTGLPGWAEALLMASAWAWPMVQGRLTRPAVTPTAKVAAALAAARASGNVGDLTYDRLYEQLVTGSPPTRGP